MNTLDENDPFAGLGDDVDAFNAVPTARRVERQKFPCEHCAGTGMYQHPRMHQPRSECFKCKGKGYFMASKWDRMKAKQKRVESKAKKLADARAAFDERNPGLYNFLNENRWSEFARSLAVQIENRGGLSDKQVDVAKRMCEKALAKQATYVEEKAAEVKAVTEAAPQFDRLAESFLTACANLKYPKLRLMAEDGQRVVLSRCGGGSKTPGHINITDGRSFGNNTYFGRITPSGLGFLAKNVPAPVYQVLREFNDNPTDAIKVQGIRTGECCCCGRELTDPVSVASGIGPVCATKWGF